VARVPFFDPAQHDVLESGVVRRFTPHVLVHPCIKRQGPFESIVTKTMASGRKRMRRRTPRQSNGGNEVENAADEPRTRNADAESAREFIERLGRIYKHLADMHEELRIATEKADQRARQISSSDRLDRPKRKRS
jgi:hypothetical protein